MPEIRSLGIVTVILRGGGGGAVFDNKGEGVKSLKSTLASSQGLPRMIVSGISYRY